MPFEIEEYLHCARAKHAVVVCPLDCAAASMGLCSPERMRPIGSSSAAGDRMRPRRLQAKTLRRRSRLTLLQLCCGERVHLMGYIPCHREGGSGRPNSPAETINCSGVKHPFAECITPAKFSNGTRYGRRPECGLRVTPAARRAGYAGGTTDCWYSWWFAVAHQICCG